MRSEVQFPTVQSDGVEFSTIRAERAPHLDHNEHSPIRGVSLPATARAVVQDARACEPVERRYDGVMLRVTGKDFHGESYGLALALSDKRCRYGAEVAVACVATGAVEPDGDGRLVAVGSFDQKALAILARTEVATESFIFAFPAANWAALAPGIAARLTAAQDAGRLKLRAAESVSELSDLWQPMTPAPDGTTQSAPPPARSPRRALLAAVAVGAVSMLAAGGWLLARQPARACETAIRQLDRQQSPDHIRAAVTVCSDAAERRPENGRVQFLAGQAHAVNGSENLARAYWRRAAENGDVDGMATWGRDVWLQAPSDRTQAHRALDWLKKAADRGSSIAMEDIAGLLLDGRALPVDKMEAERWLARAKATRERSRS